MHRKPQISANVKNCMQNNLFKGRLVSGSKSKPKIDNRQTMLRHYFHPIHV